MSIVLRGLGGWQLITQGYGMSIEEALGVISLTIDSILRTSKAKSVNLDAYLIKAIGQYDKEVSIDAVFRRVGIQTNVPVDAILKKYDLSKYVTLSAILKKEGVTASLNIDAFLQYVQTLSVGVEAVLRGLVEKGVDFDAILTRLQAKQKDILVDAILYAIGHPNKIFDYDFITTMSLDPLDTEFETDATTEFAKWIPTVFERKRR